MKRVNKTPPNVGPVFADPLAVRVPSLRSHLHPGICSSAGGFFLPDGEAPPLATDLQLQKLWRHFGLVGELTCNHGTFRQGLTGPKGVKRSCFLVDAI